MEYSGLHNKPKAAVHPGHKRTGPKEEEEDTCIMSSIGTGVDGRIMLKLY
jgi:hypothetical protein